MKNPPPVSVQELDVAFRQAAEARLAALEARQLPDIERLQVAEIRPGDTIIATAPDVMSEEGLDVIQRGLQGMFPDQKVVVVTGITIDIQREGT